jgi:uncharacterized cupredoxin-like copper-binding protein
MGGWPHVTSYPTMQRFKFIMQTLRYRSLQLGLSCLIGLLLSLISMAPSRAATSTLGPDLLRQPPIEIKVSLGNAANELEFVPDTLQFSAGKRYQLTLTNPSNSKHYFTAKDFADGIWSQKVEAGNVEIKGAIHELELKPGATAEWVFIPIKSGTYELHCSIPGHAAAGMVGKLAVATSGKA